MSTTIVVIADLIDSKEMAAKPGGVEAIRAFREQMSGELKNILQKSDGLSLPINEQKPEGDNVELRVGPSNLRFVADAVLRGLPTLLLQSSIGRKFRYTVFSINPDVSYHPRFSAFCALGKQLGKPFHLAIDRGVTNAIGSDVASWYKVLPKDEAKIKIPSGEPITGLFVDLFCKIGDDIPATTWESEHGGPMHGSIPEAQPETAGSLSVPVGVKVEEVVSEVEIIINRPFDSYTNEEQTKILTAIGFFLGIDGGHVKLVTKLRGSVKLRVALSPEQAERLIWAIKSGDFDTYDVVDANITKGTSSYDLVKRTLHLRETELRNALEELRRGNARGRLFTGDERVIAPTTDAVLEELAKPNAQVFNLLSMCRTPEYLSVWQGGPELARSFARRLLRQGHPTLALEVASRTLRDRHPGDVELMYCRAVALARCGNPTRARWFVEEMLQRTDLTGRILTDTLSLAGRVRKDLARRTIDPGVRTGRFREAFEYYRQAYELSADSFPGINAASLALLAGERELSRSLAERVRDQALTEEAKSAGSEKFWPLATLGEAYLLLGDATAAMGRYRQALRLARAAYNDGDIASMLHQLRLLKEVLPIGDDLLGLFRIGPVVVFASNGLDRPGDGAMSFPADPTLEAAVRDAIKVELDALETTIGYYSPRCGGDLLFGELMYERDAEMHMVLPYAEDDFIVEQVTYGLPELDAWRQRYEKLRGFLRVTRHFATTEPFLNDRVLYDFAGTFMQGLAITRAEQVDTGVIALVVHDPTEQPSTGLSTFLTNWRSTGHELRSINLAELRQRVSLNLPQLPSPQPTSSRASPPRSVKSMLFADVAGFSGLPEPHLPAFFIEFLALVHEELKTTSTLFANTWGDGLYIVFHDVLTCADFALRLLERLEKFNYAAHGFQAHEQKQTGIRIGLHTGPVFEGFDAIINRNNYFGSHVSRAARIEPVTMPGSAFASEQFAAALALVPGHNFLCEYLGLLPLAKDYDICHLYRLTTRTER